MSDTHEFKIAKEEIVRIRNNGCGNDWPKVWNVQLNELCDAYEASRALRAELARLRQNEARYLWLRERLDSADFAYGSPPRYVLTFAVPDDMGISADLDKSIDAAMTAEKGKP